MTPQQAREKLAEFQREHDELTDAISKTSVRPIVQRRIIGWIKRYYSDVSLPLTGIAAKDNAAAKGETS